MKKNYLTLAAVFITLLIDGQEMAPIGAEWYYSETSQTTGDIGYLRIQSVKDMMIQGKACRQLEGDYLCGHRSGTQFIHYQNDSLFFFDQELDTFQLMADFNAKKQDQWEILVWDWVNEVNDTVIVTVDSVYTQSVNQHDLITLDVTYNITYHVYDGGEIFNTVSYSYPSRIIERIGDLHYFFNFPDEMVLCEDNTSGGLRCYVDDVIGLYETGIAESCTYTRKWTSIYHYTQGSSVSVFPNPTTGLIELGLKPGLYKEVTVVDITGRALLTQQLKNSTILDISKLQSGLYMLIIKDGNEISGSARVIKK